MSPLSHNSYLSDGKPGKEWKKPTEKRFSRRDLIIVGVITAAAGALGIQQGTKVLLRRQEEEGQRAQKKAEAGKYLQDFPDHIPGCEIEKFSVEHAVRVLVTIHRPNNLDERKKTEDTLRMLIERLSAGHKPLSLYVEDVLPEMAMQTNEALQLRKERLEAAKNLEPLTMGLEGRKLEDMRSRIGALRESKDTGWKPVEDRLGVVAELMEHGRVSLKAGENPQARIARKTSVERMEEAKRLSPEGKRIAVQEEKEDMYLLATTGFEAQAFLLCADEHDFLNNVRYFNEQNPEKVLSLISVRLVPQR